MYNKSIYFKALSFLFLVSASVFTLAQETTFTDIEFTGTFGGTTYDGNYYTFPSGSEVWGGFANEDVSIYPLTFTDGGEITFTGSTAGTDAVVYFRFEYNIYPDTEPSYNTVSVTVSGMDDAPYSIELPSQGANTYSSFLLYVATLDSPVSLTDVSLTSTYSLTDVFGCTDTAASNYNEDATIEDGSCEYGIQIDLPVTFEDSTINYTMSDFGANVSTLVTDPFDPPNMVMQVVKTAQAATWAGTTIGTPAGFSTDIPLSLTDSKMTVRVWSPEAGTPIRLKVEDSNDPTHTCETESNTTVSGEWEVLEFDFINQAPGTELLSVGLDWGWTYNMASIFFNFGTEGSAAGETTYYFDDVMFGGLGADYGCIDMTACNYDPLATYNDASCIYAVEFYDCNGDCLNDNDGDSVCDELEIDGCTDSLASNYNMDATDDDGSCCYLVITLASITYEDGIGVGTVTTSGGVGEVVIVWTDSDGVVVDDPSAINEFDTYTVHVTDENGCTSSSEVTQTGLNDLDPLAFVMFPNPTTGAITLQVSTEVEDLNMQVFDATGRVVFAQDNLIVQGSISLDFSYLSTGTYTIMLSNDHGVSLLRLSIQH
ncbi:MAG: T9SS type A sorting domain-containing protein [Flavobacteriales bacterium]|nr:T9SS type A sorting domain-containing protein [Flavobacteriales bacterium]